MTTVHDPFLLRKSIFLIGVVAGVLCNAYVPFWTSFGIYFLVVTFLDCLLTFVFGVKSSKFADSKKLKSKEKISKEALDKFHRSRCVIRIVSLGIASLSQILFFSPLLFCSVYIFVTLLSSVYVRLSLKIRGPKWFYYTENPKKNVEDTNMFSSSRNDFLQGSMGLGIDGGRVRDRKS